MNKNRRFIPLVALILCSLLALFVPMSALAASGTVTDFDSSGLKDTYFTAATYEYTGSTNISGSASITTNDTTNNTYTFTLKAKGYKPDCGDIEACTTTVTLTTKKSISFQYTLNGAEFVSAPQVVEQDGKKVIIAGEGATIQFKVYSNSDKEVTGSFTLSNFADAESKVPKDCASYSVDGTPYAYLDDAITASQNASVKTIVVTGDGKVYHSSVETDADYANKTFTFTIPSGVTMLVPFNSTNTLYTTTPEYMGTDGTGTSYATPTRYRTLTLGAKTTLNIKGALSLSAKMYTADGGQAAGTPTGPVSFIDMEENSAITVQNGGFLYAWGYITGSGTVTVNNGGTVYECFQFTGWRGGNVASTAGRKVFPVSQYYVQNIEVPVTYYAGAIEFTHTSVDLTAGTTSSTVNFVGTSDAMFSLTSGSITKRYDGSTDRLIIDLNNVNSVISPIKLTVQWVSSWLPATTIDSVNYVLPITSNMTINLNSGTVTANQNLSMIPGAKLNIASGATFKMGTANSSPANLYVYDSDNWGDYCWTNGNTRFIPLAYVPGRTYTRTTADLVDAEILVNGTLDANGACIYTTTAGANIHSTENTGKVINTAGTETTTSQLQQDGTSKSYDSIDIVSAKLMNGDGTTYFESVVGENKYCATHGIWYVDKCLECNPACEHSYVPSVTTAATCTAPGLKTYTCSKCTDSYTEETPALGHKPKEDDDDCTTAITCTVCGEITTAAAAAHTEEVYADAVLPTYEKAGTSEGKKCSVCGKTTAEPAQINVAEVNGEKYTILSEAIVAAGDGGTVRLLSSIAGDVPVSQELTISKGECTANIVAGNGYEIPDPEATNVVVRKKITLDAFSLDIEGEILLNLKFRLPEWFLNDPDAYVQVTEQYFGINEAEDRDWKISAAALAELTNGQTVTSWTFGSDTESGRVELDASGRYVFSQGIAAGEMSGDVTVQFFDIVDGEPTPLNVYTASKNDIEPMAETIPETAITRSVLDYAKLAIEKAKGIEITDSSTTADKKAKALGEMCEAMLTFGAYAQEFYEHRRVDPDEGYVLLDASYKNVTETNDAVLSKIKENGIYGSTDGMTLAGALLDLDSTINMLVYFEHANNALTFDLWRPSLLGDPYMAGTIQLDSEYLELVNVPPAFWNDLYQIIPSEGFGEICTAKFCVYDWIRGCLTSGTNESEQKMAIAMYNYAEAADAYFALKYGS